MLDIGIPIALGFIGVFVMVKVLAELIAALIYDTRLARLHHDATRHPKARRYRYRPMVTVLIPTHNNEKTITACLESLSKARYKKLQIIVVDAASSDATRKLVRSYSRENIRLCANRTTAISSAVLQRAYKKYGNGELVMVLQPDATLQPDTLQAAVRHYNINPSMEGIMAAVTYRPPTNLLQLLATYYNFMQQRSQKLRTYLDVVAPTGSAVMYRGSAWLQHSKGQSINMWFASDVSVLARPKLTLRSNTQGIRLYLRAVMATQILLVPTMITYSTYLAYKLHQATFLVLAIGVMTLVLMVAVTNNAQLSWQQKLSYILTLPIAVGLFAFVSVARVGTLLNSGRSRLLAGLRQGRPGNLPDLVSAS